MPTTQIARYAGVISPTGLIKWTMKPAQLATLGLTTTDNMRFTCPNGGVYLISCKTTPAHAGWKPNKSTYSVTFGGPTACQNNSTTAHWDTIETFEELDANPGSQVIMEPGENVYVALYARGYTPPDDNPNLPALLSGQLKVTKLL